MNIYELYGINKPTFNMIITEHNANAYIPLTIEVPSQVPLTLHRNNHTWGIIGRKAYDNPLIAKFTIPDSIPAGEYTYTIGGNKGILLIMDDERNNIKVHTDNTFIEEYEIQ